jgi:WhiB family redox-sensing transcriptional regulator
VNSEWMSRGKCRELPWDVFFPREGPGVLQAKKICAACPVSGECLDYALEHHIDHGVWGGSSERERARVRRIRRVGPRPVGVG